MGVIFEPVNLALLIAAFVIFWWLRSVFGQRTGLERPPKEIEVIPPSPMRKLADVKANPASDPMISETDLKADSVTQGLAAIRTVQTDFVLADFMAGAKAAHELILTAFAQGKKETLKPLLTEPVFVAFAGEIEERRKQGNSVNFKFVSINAADVKSALLEKKQARISIEFLTDVVSATYNKANEKIAGDDKMLSRINEQWTFVREVGSRDPNWKLAETTDPDDHAQ